MVMTITTEESAHRNDDLGSKGVLARAAMLLDAFAWDKPVLSLNELSVATGLPSGERCLLWAPVRLAW